MVSRTFHRLRIAHCGGGAFVLAGQITADTGPRGWLTPAAWNLLHPTRLAFEGVAWLALLTAALATAYSWRDKAPAWGLILGFALLWILGALGTYFLVPRSVTAPALWRGHTGPDTGPGWRRG